MKYEDIRAGQILRHRPDHRLFLGSPPLYLVVDWDPSIETMEQRYGAWKALGVTGLWEILYPNTIKHYTKIDLSRTGRKGNPWMVALRTFDQLQREKGYRP